MVGSMRDQNENRAYIEREGKKMIDNKKRRKKERKRAQEKRSYAHAARNDPHEGLLLVLWEVTRTGRLLRITVTIRLAIRPPAFLLSHSIFPSLVRSLLISSSHIVVASVGLLTLERFSTPIFAHSSSHSSSSFSPYTAVSFSRVIYPSLTPHRRCRRLPRPKIPSYRSSSS